jgi:DNA excision repair protein ERCC-2
VLANYGRLLIDLAASVPDGIVAFFTSYRYMEDLVSAWKESKILDELLKHKLIFIETKDIVETTLALDAFKRACDRGRGAVFFSVARGKVAEGIDFDRHYGRAVIMFGIPFQYILSRPLRARLNYLREKHHMSEKDFLSFDALRQTAQCVGRVIRSKMDYGLMVFADQRFQLADKRAKLPGWINQYLDKGHCNLSTDRALSVAKEFLKNMAQPRSQAEELGTTMLDIRDIEKIQLKQRQKHELEAPARAAEKAEEERIAALSVNNMFALSNNIGVPRPPPQQRQANDWTQMHAAAATNTTIAAPPALAAAPAAAAASASSSAPAPMDVE